MSKFFEVIQLDRSSLRRRIATQQMGNWCKFLTGHNTSVPSLTRWAVNRQKYTPAQLASFMEDGWRSLGWHTGVHYLIPPDDDTIFELSDPSAPGVHASCFNYDSIGIEMVGDYSWEKFDTGPGANVLDKFVYLTALLHNHLGLRPDGYVYGRSGLHWHFACQRDNHDCPGEPMRKAGPQIIQRILEKMAELKMLREAAAPGLGDDLAARYIHAMQARNITFDAGPGHANICYAEGMNPDGTPNANTPNEFNDLRMVIMFENNKPVTKGRWVCTTEPSRYWTIRPMDAHGAARLTFGKHVDAWQHGYHHGDPNHEALVQTGGTVTVQRDLKEDFKRDGPIYTGMFGINHHRAYGEPINNMGLAGAGCCVGWDRAQHAHEFMPLVKSDPRYIANREFKFSATLLPAKEI